MTSSTAQQQRSIRPHRGPQETYLATPADIAIYGGAAGGGKSWALEVEPLRHIGNPRFGAVIFRRTHPELTNQGGLWDESLRLYPQLGGQPRVSELKWVFPSGASITFGHMQHETDVMKWHSSAIALISFDELTTFTEHQFWYMQSRNRSTSGVRPYIRATTNPDADSWVAKFIAWWIDSDTGYAIPERSGVLRWFIRKDGELHWGDSRTEVFERFKNPYLPENHKEQPFPKSVTFVSASLEDNETLNRINPEYRASLMALPPVEQARLLRGNWKIRKTAGSVFKTDRLRERIIDLEDVPKGLRFCRGWDLASTDAGGDYTASCKMGLAPDGAVYIFDVSVFQFDPDKRDKRIVATAQSDGKQCRIRLPQDPGQAGKSQHRYIGRLLVGFPYRFEPVTGKKDVRASGLASAMNAGNVYLVRGDWNDRYLSRLDAFPTKGIPDDEIDASADAFNELTGKQMLAVGTTGGDTEDAGELPSMSSRIIGGDE